MIISANGIVFNEHSDVLLVQRDDTRTLAPPGGACEIDELPDQAAAREVREETGLIVYPVRLVGLYYLPAQPIPYLFLCFRCIQRGGDLTTSTETPSSGFFTTTPLPSPMLAMHQEQIQNAFHHSGGPPYWGKHQISPTLRAGNFLLNRLVNPMLNFRRSRLNQPQYVPPPQWLLRATLLLRNSTGDILLQQDDTSGQWALPSSDAVSSGPPWDKANQLIQEILNGQADLRTLSGIYLRQGKPEMAFVFTGNLREGNFPPSFSGALFAPDSLPHTLSPGHEAMIANANASEEQVVYKLLS